MTSCVSKKTGKREHPYRGKRPWHSVIDAQSARAIPRGLCSQIAQIRFWRVWRCSQTISSKRSLRAQVAPWLSARLRIARDLTITENVRFLFVKCQGLCSAWAIIARRSCLADESVRLKTATAFPVPRESLPGSPWRPGAL